jgi:hypothetical protein
LFQPVTGLEVAERYSDEETTDDVRAWKIVARRGEWVKVPLLVPPPEEGRFVIDADREDTEVLAAQWQSYPRWFQDAMRFKYPRLRDLYGYPKVDTLGGPPSGRLPQLGGING